MTKNTRIKLSHILRTLFFGVATTVPSLALSELASAKGEGIALTPGVYSDGKSYDISLLYYFEDSGAFSFYGLNGGSIVSGTPSTYAELEIGGSAWGLLSMVLGAGVYELRDKHAAQATASLQVILPCIFYMRYRDGSTTFKENWFQGMDFGLIWKVPIPIANQKDNDWNWGTSFNF